MHKRIGPILRIACLILAGVVLFQLSRLFLRKDSVGELNFEPVVRAAEKPAAVQTNAPPAAARLATARPPELPPAIRAQVDRITQSEILAAVVRPLPMALLGIAGPDALIRTPSGQTGLLREGEELGGVKLLRIGTNRVLIEHEQQEKELTVFAGLGGDSLLSKGEKKPQ